MDPTPIVPIPLTTSETGAIRIGNSRVRLDTVVYAFNEGYTAEEIVIQYPSLILSEVYAVIAYYLSDRTKVDTYIAEKAEKADTIREEIESRPEYQAFRQKLLEQRVAVWLSGSFYSVLMMLLMTLITASCSSTPSEAQIQTAIAQTAEDQPSPSPIPTSTPLPSPTEVSLPTSFIRNADNFINAATRISAATDQGVSYEEFDGLLKELHAMHNLVEATWPSGFAIDSRDSFHRSILGWDLAMELWEMEINEWSEPAESDGNFFTKYLDYAGDDLRIGTKPFKTIEGNYRNINVISFDNIGVLMGLASHHFENGRSQLLPLLD